MMIKRGVTALLIALLSIATYSASGSVPTLKATLEPDSIGIGDRFTYSIIVESDMVQGIAFPEFENSKESPVELVESMPIDTLEQDGRRLVLRKRYKLTSFEEGLLNLGRAQVLYLDKNITDTLYSADSIIARIHTFQIDSTSQSIYDLKGVRDMPFKFKEISGYTQWGLLIIALLAIAIYVIGRVLKARGKRFSDLFKPAPLPPAHLEAIRALEDLHNQKLWQNQKYKEYYSSLTQIARHYIARRFEVAAMEMTSDEINEAMRNVDLPTKSRMDLNALLAEADLVKFAKATPEADENEANYFRVYYFVEETKIQEEGELPTESEILNGTADDQK